MGFELGCRMLIMMWKVKEGNLVHRIASSKVALSFVLVFVAFDAKWSSEVQLMYSKTQVW